MSPSLRRAELSATHRTWRRSRGCSPTPFLRTPFHTPQSHSVLPPQHTTNSPLTGPKQRTDRDNVIPKNSAETRAPPLSGTTNATLLGPERADRRGGPVRRRIPRTDPESRSPPPAQVRAGCGARRGPVPPRRTRLSAAERRLKSAAGTGRGGRGVTPMCGPRALGRERYLRARLLPGLRARVFGGVFSFAAVPAPGCEGHGGGGLGGPRHGARRGERGGGGRGGEMSPQVTRGVRGGGRAAPLKPSCYPNTSKQRGRRGGAGRGRAVGARRGVGLRRAGGDSSPRHSAL